MIILQFYIESNLVSKSDAINTSNIVADETALILLIVCLTDINGWNMGTLIMSKNKKKSVLWAFERSQKLFSNQLEKNMTLSFRAAIYRTLQFF